MYVMLIECKLVVDRYFILLFLNKNNSFAEQ